MIYYPVFGQRPCFHGGSQDDYLRDLVSPYKDIEGLCHFYRRSLYRNRRFVDSAGTQKCILPCTPLAIVKVLEHLEAYDTARPVGDRLQGMVCERLRSPLHLCGARFAEPDSSFFEDVLCALRCNSC